MSTPTVDTNIGSGLEGISETPTPQNNKKGLLKRLGNSISQQRNALTLAGALAVGAGSVAAAPGCAYETSGAKENTGTAQSAILSDWAEGQAGQFNGDPHTYWESATSGHRTFISNRAGDMHGYISYTTDGGANWTTPVLINTPAGDPVNPAGLSISSLLYYKEAGTGKLIVSSPLSGVSDDFWTWDYDAPNNQASNGQKITQISGDFTSDYGADVNDAGTLMIYASNENGGCDTDIWQVNLPGFTNPQKITGLATPECDGYPFFFGSDDKIAFSSMRNGSSKLGSNIFIANNYNPSTHSVGSIVAKDELNSDLNDGSGSTDSKGETCISVEISLGKSVIKCDPTIPGPSIPDGGVGGAGGAGGAAGAGGSVNTGGTAGTGGVAGQGGAEAGVDADTDAEIDGAAGMAGQAGSGGTAGTGGIAGQGGAEAGVDADTDAEIDGAAGMAGQAGAGGTINTGGSGGVAGSAGEGGKAGAGGTAGEGGKGGTAGAGGGTPECPIKVEGDVNCTITDCDNYEQGGTVTLHTVNDCTFTDPLNDRFHITGTGNAFLDHYDITGQQSVKIEVTHPSGNPKVSVGYQTDNGTNVNAGTLGTIYDMSMEVRDNIKGFLVHVTESASDVRACDSNNQNCVAVNLFDMGAGPGIVTQGNSQFMSFSDLDALVKPVVQPDAGPNITPPAEGDGGGCNVHGQSPEGINGYTFGLLLALGLVARRKKNE